MEKDRIGSYQLCIFQKHHHQRRGLIDLIDEMHLTRNPSGPKRSSIAIHYLVQLVAKWKMFPRGIRDLFNLISDNADSITLLHESICSIALESQVWAFAFEVRRVERNYWLYVYVSQLYSCFLLYANDRRRSFVSITTALLVQQAILSATYMGEAELLLCLPDGWDQGLALDDINTYKSQATKPTFGL